MAVELPSSEADVRALLESAVSSRASHIRRESQTITMANVRRLLEGDLGLETSALDIHKGFIRQLVDQVLLNSGEAETQEEEVEEEEEGKSEEGDAEEDEEKEEEDIDEDVPKRLSSSSAGRSSIKKAKVENGSVKEEFEDVRTKAPKKKQQKEKKRKPKEEEDEDGGESPEDDVCVEVPKKKQRKEKEVGRSKVSDEEEEGSNGAMSEEESDISEGKKVKKVSPKMATVKPMQSKKVEHLKKIIKACGMGIPPHMYKRAKQQPEDKQDKFLVKELEEMLSRRGLSSDPSDKEIKAVKQKIAREKDLEGIDTTNIIMESRGRRATSQLFAPVYNPPPPPEYDSEEGDNDEESEDSGESGSEDERNDSGGGAADDTEDSE